jgi:hypothetical protein
MAFFTQDGHLLTFAGLEGENNTALACPVD